MGKEPMRGEDNADHDPSTVVEYVVGGGRELFGRNTMTAQACIRAFFSRYREGKNGI
jgi:hypothetical protein